MRHLLFVGMVVIFLSGCDTAVQPMQQAAAPSPNRNQDSVSDRAQTVGPTDPASPPQDVQSKEPAESGYLFTLWGPHLRPGTLYFKYKVKGRMPSNLYRIVLETPTDTYYADAVISGFGADRGTFELSLAFVGGSMIHPFPQGANIFIEEVRRPNGTTTVSNTIRLEPDERRVLGSSQPKGPSLGMGSKVDAAWRNMRKSLGEVAKMDTALRLADVTVDAKHLLLSQQGIAQDPRHPEFFAANLALLDESREDVPGLHWDASQKAALRRLATADPTTCKDADHRKKIAKLLASQLDSDFPLRGNDFKTVLHGLAAWGGKYSVPLLIDALNEASDFGSSKFPALKDIVEVLGDLGDERAVEPLARLMAASAEFGSPILPDHVQTMAESLVKIGPAAEDAMIQLAPSNSPRVSLAAIYVLAEVGTRKSFSLLKKAQRSSNPQIRRASKEAQGRIEARVKGNS